MTLRSFFARAGWLLPLAALVTPNLPEAEVLSKRSINRFEDRLAAARVILGTGARAVVVKGGHGGDDPQPHRPTLSRNVRRQNPKPLT